MNLFSPFEIRGVTLRNRIVVSPMCQYSCEDGFATDWHLVHLGSRAVGGAAVVIAEATAVEARGRISPGDLGIWKDEHVPPLARAAAFIRSQGALAGIQIAHAGRKASTDAPWRGGAALSTDRGGWQPVAPSPIPFREGDPAPHELSGSEIQDIVRAFADAAKRASTAGFEVLEIHSAHGYLSHEFLSPLANHRTDEYGGALENFENRIRFCLEVIAAVRAVWPERLPLFLRISATDWVEGGWSIQQSVELARRARPLGVDLVDCSSGAIVPWAKVNAYPGYQVPFADRIRRDAGIPTGAVGLITDPAQANEIISSGRADLVFLAREMLRDPYWPRRAARTLALEGLATPPQYLRAW